MKNIALILGLIAMVGCSEQKTDEIATNTQYIQNWEEANEREFTPGSSFELLYGGELILIENEGDEEEVHSIQSVTRQEEDVLFTAKKIPTVLYLKNQGLEGERLETALTELENEQLFYFDFADELKQDILKKNFKEGYEEAVSYLAFGVENDFQLISGVDTLKSNYAQYERTFHLAPYERVLVSFSGANFTEDFELIYNDILFNKGRIDFQFAPESLLTQNSDPS
ncbi:MAG: hypothetical protein MK078_18055 [Crocinitomicaceae bacterium]|nr:hypothetical protein [Crocinitomicaceae bacterium]